MYPRTPGNELRESVMYLQCLWRVSLNNYLPGNIFKGQIQINVVFFLSFHLQYLLVCSALFKQVFCCVYESKVFCVTEIALDQRDDNHAQEATKITG